MRKEVEINILGKYPSYILNLDSLINDCIIQVKLISENRPEWIINNDVRYTIYGEYISVLNANKILIFNLLNFINKTDWVDIYNNEFAILPQVDDFSYLKEVDTSLRFGLYMKFVSLFECYILNITRYLKFKNIKCSTNYSKFLNENLKISSHEEFLKIVRHLRNSIHNNGYHIPDEDKYNFVTIEYHKLKFSFEVNKRVELIWNDTFSVFEELIKLSVIVSNSEIVNKEKIISING